MPLASSDRHVHVIPMTSCGCCEVPQECTVSTKFVNKHFLFPNSLPPSSGDLSPKAAGGVACVELAEHALVMLGEIHNLVSFRVGG